MINAIEWFKEKGFTFDDKITIEDVIALQEDARKHGAGEPCITWPTRTDGKHIVLYLRDGNKITIEREKGASWMEVKQQLKIVPHST